MTEKSNKSIVTFITALMVLSLFLIGGALVWVSNPANITNTFLAVQERKPDLEHTKVTHWQGFSITYPGNWILEQDKPGNTGLRDYLSVHSPGGSGLKFTIFDGPEVMSLDDEQIKTYLNDLINTSIKEGSKNAKYNDTKELYKVWGKFHAFGRKYKVHLDNSSKSAVPFVFDLEVSFYLIKFKNKILGVQEVRNLTTSHISEPAFTMIKEKFKSNLATQGSIPESTSGIID